MVVNRVRSTPAVSPAVACERDRQRARRKLILRIVALTDALRRLELDAKAAGEAGVLSGVEASNLRAAAETVAVGDERLAAAGAGAAPMSDLRGLQAAA